MTANHTWLIDVALMIAVALLSFGGGATFLITMPITESPELPDEQS